MYILSPRYSGSTLLSFLIATHPEVSTIGERRKFFIKSFKPNHKGSQNCSCGKLFKDCDYWNALKQKLQVEYPPKTLTTNVTEFQLSTNKMVDRLAIEISKFCLLRKIPRTFWPLGKRIQLSCDFNLSLVKTVLQMDGTSVFLDSSKSIQHALFLSLIPHFDFYVIWLVRDPRAQVNSALKYNPWTVETAAKNWVSEVKMNQKILQKWKPNYLELRYEQLCKAPEKEMKNILRFVGLNENQFSLNFRDQSHHIMGNQSMRLGKDMKIVERKDWKSKLSKAQIEIIETLTKNYQQYYSD